ncbi:YbbR-like domain-containing protein [Streptococcus halichoeri]|uniref:CdaR family protein n=1 Tax=Streptococcus halichoeri TaxID=254785 RepID=UPI000DB8D83F|nr:CdaR family protein [Streptococcus halichoeri]PZO95826.1 MAG: hypothetical protein DI617_02750 [Streptococcus pyogenes]
MKKFLNSRLWLGLVSIFFAVLLFLTAVSSNQANSANPTYGPVETYTHSLSDVPIDMKYDSDKYFISEYSYGAQVYLSSTNRVKLDSEVNTDTRKFKIVADLSKSKPGKVSVPLSVTNLPSGVVAKVTPDKISVTIGKRRTKTFSVTPSIDPKQIQPGYEVGKIEVGDAKVKVTSNESTIDTIDHVVAKLPENQKLSADYHGSVTLQAVSADGTILASTISPATTELSVSVKKITKTVPIRVNLFGQMDSSLASIVPKLSNETATISASQEVLDTIDEVIVDVPISGVTKSTIKTVKVSAGDLVSVEPKVVSVQLTTKKK